MSYIKPSYVEKLFNAFLQLDPDRPRYYNNVINIGKQIFMHLGFHEYIKELDEMIEEKIEKPFNAPLSAVLDGYYSLRFMHMRLAYCKIGHGIDARHVTRYEMTQMFEDIKDWIEWKVSELTPYIRFTTQQEILK